MKSSRTQRCVWGGVCVAVILAVGLAAAKPKTRPTTTGKKASQADAAAGEWVCFRGPHRDGKSSDKGLLKQWPSDGPKLLWKVNDIGAGFSSVTTAADRVYITGTINGKFVVSAYDLAGKPQWRSDLGDDFTKSHPGARSSVTIDGDRLYVLTGMGTLCCLDARAGRRIWFREAREFGGSPGTWGYAESVLIYQNLAVFKPGGNNCIVALDKTSGKPVWNSRGFKAGPEYSSCLLFEFEGQPLIATGTREGIVCVSARNGALLWSNPFCANNVANCPTPAYSDGHVFWANGYNKGGICLRMARGGKAAEAWTTKDMVCHHGGYVIHEGYIYGNNGSGWACLELKSGQTMWKEKAVGKGSLCWADNMFYLFSEDGGQAALATCSPKGMEIQGRVKVEGSGPSWAHPVVIGGRLYLRYDTNLYCFDVKAP